MKKLINYLLKNSLMINLISVAIFIAGLIFMVSANREAFPKIDFGYVIISTVYPGATASDVEKLISIPLEDQLREVDGLDEVSSYSSEATSVIVIKLNPDLDDQSKIVNDIQSAVDKTTDLPEDATDPVVTELSMAEQPVITVSVINTSGINNDKDEFELREYAKTLENKLKNINEVASIKKYGYREREMMVEVDLRKLDTYRVALNDVISALSAKNVNFPGGLAKIGGEEVLIRTIGEVETTSEIANIVIRSNDLGNIVKIKDVAQVKDTFEELKLINKTNGGNSIALTILKKENADIIDLVDKVKSDIEKFKEILPSNYSIVQTDDLSQYVRRRLNVLSNNALVGIVLVVLSLFLAFGWRIALVTAAGLPIAFAGTFYWMGAQNISINLMSMFGLIMVLGMIVDDAIIVAENIYRHVEEGENIRDAVINGTTEVMIPVAGTILTTIAAFAPLMFMSGIMGKFMWILPAVVSIALIMSWLEAMFILPSHVYDIEKNNKKNISRKASDDKYSPLKLRLKYKKAIMFILKHKFVTIILVTLLFLGTIAFSIVKIPFVLFPSAGIEIFVIRAEAPIGTTVREMNEKMSVIEKKVAELPPSELDSFVTTSGESSIDASDPNGKTGSQYGMIKVNLTPSQGRKRKAQEIIDKLREDTADDHKLFDKIEFTKVQDGPPTSSPISVIIKGKEFDTLKEISSAYKDYLGKTKGVKDIKDSLENEKSELQIFINPEISAKTGVTVYDVASTVRSCYSGSVATEIKKAEEEINIRVILPEKDRSNFDSLNKINVSNRMGNLIPLNSIAYFKRSKGIATINRKDFQRFASVTADIDTQVKDATSSKINLAMQQEFKDIEKKYPGYTVSYEGEFEDTMQSFKDLAISFLIALMVIYIILVGIFKTLHHPLLVMAVIPLTFIGVAWAFFFHNELYKIGLFNQEMPLSFMSLMGVVGLAGVVVNDSIVLVTFINNARKKGFSPYQASVNAGIQRLRPIILTSATTILGLIPTAYGIGGLDEFLVPMAIAMSFGLAFGTLITLFYTPVIYNTLYTMRYLIGNYLFGRHIEKPCYEYDDSLECIDPDIEVLIDNTPTVTQIQDTRPAVKKPRSTKNK
ncbi:MAG: efflux RND transporter permease subunit [Spirochaetes bacterium]|nr:efflux RND transporter permease subunit [Spirochaetota bacterium]